MLFLPSTLATVGAVEGDRRTPELRVGHGIPQAPTGLATSPPSKQFSAERAVWWFPLPYDLPPAPYQDSDVPWAWDRKYTTRDVLGKTW